MHFLHYLLVSLMSFFGRYRIIREKVDNEAYLERFYIFLKDRQNFPFNIFLHRFIKSDSDDLHDHPWNFRTIILYGGYWEITENASVWCGPMSYRYAEANTFHRIQLDENIPYCWTLFIPGKTYKEWGFRTKDGWKHHVEYFKWKKKAA